jgi:hypothetical protein
MVSVFALVLSALFTALVLLHLDHLLGVLVEQLAVAHGVIEREAG